MNTIMEWQIFSALPFSEYDPNLMTYPRQATLDINKHYGHFDPFNFDHLSFYAKDYVTSEYTKLTVKVINSCYYIDNTFSQETCRIIHSYYSS